MIFPKATLSIIKLETAPKSSNSKNKASVTQYWFVHLFSKNMQILSSYNVLGMWIQENNKTNITQPSGDDEHHKLI